jgi:hypothetical protein
MMFMPLLLKYFLLWFPMLFIAIGNGAIRDLGYKKITGELKAQQVSTIVLIILFAIYIGYIVYEIPFQTPAQALAVGIFWLVLTLAFEFGMGRFTGHSWSSLFEDYNILKGKLWLLIPVWVTIAPYIFYRLSRR